MRALAAVALLVTTPAFAQPSVESFYKGRTVEMTIGTQPGGGYDLYGRLVARWLGKHIPGNPTVVVKNMPGAGHLRMTNWLYNVAPKDGTVLATAPQALAIEQALGSEGIQYDAAMPVIGRRDDDGVDRFLGQKIVIVRVRLGASAGAFDGALHTAFVGVDHAHDLRVLREFQDDLHQLLRAGARPYHPDSDLAVG